MLFICFNLQFQDYVFLLHNGLRLTGAAGPVHARAKNESRHGESTGTFRLMQQLSRFIASMLAAAEHLSGY